MTLNDQQLEVSNHHQGPLLCVAGAGSGKTTTMVANLINKYQMGIEPMRVMATAFNKDAALQIKERVMKACPELPGNIPIGTSHSLMLRILRRQGLVYDNVVAEWHAKDIIRKSIGKEYKNGEEGEILQAIALFKNQCAYYKPIPNTTAHLDYEDIYRAVAEEIGLKHETVLTKAFMDYESTIKKQRFIDNEDMLFLTWVLFNTKPEVLTVYQDYLQHLLIDEYQDTNRVQHELFTMLAAKHRNIIVVGDPDQSIYSFRGSDPTYLLKFDEQYPDAKLIILESNYRSQSLVIETTNHLIGHNKVRMEKELIATKPAESKPVVVGCSGERDEAACIADSIQADIETERKEIAVLLRTHAQGAWIEEAFVERNIPYDVVKGSSFFKRPEITTLINYIRYAVEPDLLLAKELANKPYRFIAADTINSWKTMDDMHNDGLWNRGVANLIEQLAFVRACYTSYDLHTMLDYVINAGCWYARWLKQNASLSSTVNPVSMITQFCDMMAGKNFEQCLAAVDKVLSHLENTSDAHDADRVRILTIFTAKGLEWDSVYVPGFNDEMLPHKSNNDIEEERRIAYVALTRAKRKLMLTTLSSAMPSLFLSEMESLIDTNTYEAAEKTTGFVVVTEPETQGHEGSSDMAQVHSGTSLAQTV